MTLSTSARYAGMPGLFLTLAVSPTCFQRRSRKLRSPAVWHVRWYNQPMGNPTARIRELRATPTEAEKAAWNLLRDRGLGAKFRRQFRRENWVLDFYCFEHRLAIEPDGGVHSQIDQTRRDAAKEDYLRTLGIQLLRVPNAMVLEHPAEFVRKIVGMMGENAKK